MNFARFCQLQFGPCLSARIPGLTIILFVFHGCSQEQHESAAYQLLFGTGESALSSTEKTSAFKVIEQMFPLSADGSRLEHASCGDIAPHAEVVDLNADGVQEVFVQWGNTCTSGMTGRSLGLMVKNAEGVYQYELGFPALAWQVMESSTQDWPDLSFGGTGFCRAVWARGADGYEFKCNIPQDGNQCLRPDQRCPVP